MEYRQGKEEEEEEEEEEGIEDKLSGWRKEEEARLRSKELQEKQGFSNICITAYTNSIRISIQICANYLRIKSSCFQTANIGRFSLSKVLPGAFPPKHFQTPSPPPKKTPPPLACHPQFCLHTPPPKKNGGVWLLVPKRGKNREWGGGHTYWGLGRQVAGKKWVFEIVGGCVEKSPTFFECRTFAFENSTFFQSPSGAKK